MSSLRFRGASQIARQQEWDAMTGARKSRSHRGKFDPTHGKYPPSSEPVHFPHDFPAEIGKAIVSRSPFEESAQSVAALCVKVI